MISSSPILSHRVKFDKKKIDHVQNTSILHKIVIQIIKNCRPTLHLIAPHIVRARATTSKNSRGKPIYSSGK